MPVKQKEQHWKWKLRVSFSGARCGLGSAYMTQPGVAAELERDRLPECRLSHRAIADS